MFKKLIALIYYLLINNDKMLSESLINIDKNISFAQNLRNLLKTEINTNASHSPKSTNLIKIKLGALKLQTQKLRINIIQIRNQIPKSFQEFLPSQFWRFLVDEKKILRQLSVNSIQSYNNKQNLRLGNIDYKKSNANQEKLKAQQKLKNQIRNKNLRNQIYQQLEQLKGLEKRQNIVRSFNQSVSNRKESSIQNARPTIKQRRKIIEDNPIDRLFGKTILIESESVYSSEDSRVSISTLNADIPIVISKFTFDKTNNKQCSLYCPSRHEYYSGNVVNGIPNGNGRLVNCCSKIPIKISQNIQSYNGYFANGKFEGIGTLSFTKGIKFVGTFKQGERQGEGSLYYNGKVDVGRWKNDQLIQTI